MAVVEHPEKFLLSTGLLYNINRTVLHPLGLSLTVTVSEDTGEEDATVHVTLHQTDDLEGFKFPEEQIENMEARWQKYLSTQRPRLLAKAQKLGFIQQPVTSEAAPAP